MKQWGISYSTPEMSLKEKAVLSVNSTIMNDNNRNLGYMLSNTLWNGRY